METYHIPLWEFGRIDSNLTVDTSLRYPKPGTPNPIPTVTIIDLLKNSTVTIPIGKDEILGEVLASSWFFVAKILTRDQRSMRTVSYNATKFMTETKYVETGWINLVTSPCDQRTASPSL